MQGLTEYSCFLLMDADTLVVGELDPLLDCSSVLPHGKLIAGVQDYKRGRWVTYNTGNLLMRQSELMMPGKLPSGWLSLAKTGYGPVTGTTLRKKHQPRSC